ncbi:MarR family winged helix-turn-helix transcriptional regulator [Nocardia carnea]|uniref:MarR family winged helix-turn-helix transcriptional regulator n=1 Tax=Nocardia TaxID=1817 RepID=UPI0024553FB1|nr:MarR family transcriptional regulator [Nocardia carnea]
MDTIEQARRQWALRFPELDVRPLDIFGRVRRIGSVLQSLSDEVLESYGITRADFDILSVLGRFGRAMTPTEIAAETVTSAPGTTKRIKRLVDAGLIVRLPNPQDGRGALISLSAEAEAFLEPVLQAISRLENEYLAQLPPGAIDALRVHLTSLLECLEDSERALRVLGTRS